ncbi:MAG: DNA polymerase III subunit alpha, partial [Aggregatilineales bacterium]
EAFDLLSRGETIGVFQVESAGMQSMLRGMRPERYENIVAGVSLYRPGPMDFIPTYNERLHSQADIPYLHERLEPILAETQGIIIYQEQILQIAGELFGYKLGEADLMRKAVSKKKMDKLVEHKSIFMERGPENGISEIVAEEIFDQIEFFANYGFNKSHASNYAMITVQTAYLKAHYPEEFMTAMLSVHHGDSTKVSTFLEECRRMNIPVLPPDVNHSMLDFDIEDTEDGKRGIRFGLAAIKNASSGALEQIIENRKTEGGFESLEDFCHRVNLREVGKRTLESLVKVNALVGFGDRNTLYSALERLVGFSADYHKAQSIGQISMFGGDSGFVDTLNLPDISDEAGHSFREQLKWEKELLGLYVSGRPVDNYREFFQQSKTTMIQALKDPDVKISGEKVRIAGEVTEFREIYTKNNDAMAIMQIEDWHDSAGVIEVVMFPRTWKRIKDTFTEDEKILDNGEIVVVEGKFDTERDAPQVIADNVRTDFTVLMSDNPYDEYVPDIVDAMLLYDEDGEVIGMSDTPVNVPAMMMGEAVAQQSMSSNQNNGHAHTNGYSSNGNGQHDAAASISYESPATDLDFDTMTPPPDDDAPLYATSQNDVKRHIRVYMNPSKDAEQDRRRIINLHNIFIASPGQDSFTIVVCHSRRNVPVHFPHDTTGCTEKLLAELHEFVGEENIEILDRH